MEIKQKHEVKNSDFNEETNEMSAPTSAKKTRELNSKVLYIHIELSTLQNWKNWEKNRTRAHNAIENNEWKTSDECV